MMLAIVTVSCALIIAPELNLILNVFYIGFSTQKHPNPLLAPQATLMASVSRAMFGGTLPWTIVWIGAAIGAAIIAFDLWQKKRGSSFRAPVLAAAVGIYLPLEYTMPIFLGGLLSYLVERRHGSPKDEHTKERIHRKAVLFSAGLITGEALTGILIAIPIVASGRMEILALPRYLQFGEWLGLLLFMAIGWILFSVGAKTNTEAS